MNEIQPQQRLTMLGHRPRTHRKAARQLRAQRIKRWECHLNYPADLTWATLQDWRVKARLALLQSMHAGLYERPADTSHITWMLTMPIMPDELLVPLREMVADLVEMVVPADQRRDAWVAKTIVLRRSAEDVRNGIFTVTVSEVKL